MRTALKSFSLRYSARTPAAKRCPSLTKSTEGYITSFPALGRYFSVKRGLRARSPSHSSHLVNPAPADEPTSAEARGTPPDIFLIIPAKLFFSCSNVTPSACMRAENTSARAANSASIRESSSRATRMPRRRIASVFRYASISTERFLNGSPHIFSTKCRRSARMAESASNTLNLAPSLMRRATRVSIHRFICAAFGWSP